MSSTKSYRKGNKARDIYREVTDRETDDKTFRFFALIRSVFSITRGGSPDRSIGIIRHLIPQ